MPSERACRRAFRFIVSQRLIAKRWNRARCRIRDSEIHLRTREYIEKGEGEGKTLLDAMRDGANEGMQYFDGEIEKLMRTEDIEIEVGLSHATNAGNLRLQIADLLEPQQAPSFSSPKVAFGSAEEIER